MALLYKQHLGHKLKLHEEKANFFDIISGPVTWLLPSSFQDLAVGGWPWEKLRVWAALSSLVMQM